MATVTIRIDEAVERALQALTRSGRSRSEVVREAILAADREARRAQMRAEAEALRDDPTEIAAMKQLAADMESIRAW